MSLITKPSRAYFCNVCQAIRSLDQPCPHIEPAPWRALPWRAWGLCFVVSIVSWGAIYLLGHALGGW